MRIVRVAPVTAGVAPGIVLSVRVAAAAGQRLAGPVPHVRMVLADEVVPKLHAAHVVERVVFPVLVHYVLERLPHGGDARGVPVADLDPVSLDSNTMT